MVKLDFERELNDTSGRFNIKKIFQELYPHLLDHININDFRIYMIAQHNGEEIRDQAVVIANQPTRFRFRKVRQLYLPVNLIVRFYVFTEPSNAVGSKRIAFRGVRGLENPTWYDISFQLDIIINNNIETLTDNDLLQIFQDLLDSNIDELANLIPPELDHLFNMALGEAWSIDDDETPITFPERIEMSFINLITDEVIPFELRI